MKKIDSKGHNTSVLQVSKLALCQWSISMLNIAVPLQYLVSSSVIISSLLAQHEFCYLINVIKNLCDKWLSSNRGRKSNYSIFTWVGRTWCMKFHILTEKWQMLRWNKNIKRNIDSKFSGYKSKTNENKAKVQWVMSHI